MLAGLSELTAPQIKSLDEHKLVWCIGEVAAGVWRESFEWPRDEWLPVLISIHDERYPGVQRRALRVRGDSMDQLYPNGSFVVFVRLGDIGGGKPQPGDRVIVLRHRHGTSEATVKEYSRDTLKRRWLLPKSTNPSHAAIALDQPEGDEVIDIMGLVVGSQRIE